MKDFFAMPDDSFFQGKVVLLYLKNPPEAFVDGIAIYKPVLRELNGRHFVIGTVPSTAYDWASGQRVGVAFEQVAHFLEFADETEFAEKSSFAAYDGNQGLPT